MATKKLVSASRVAVVGGGPAGSFFALYLFRYGQSRGVDAKIDIYEPRSFAVPGPRGCNRCAGILSASLVQNLKELALDLPSAVVQSQITGYSLHSPYGVIDVQNPDPQSPIYSVYRGGGPLRFPVGVEASLDNFLLERAKASGARVISRRVTAIHLSPSPRISCEGQEYPYDLVALAGGVNALGVEVEGARYTPPRARRMAQDELHARPEDIAAAFGNRVRVCLFPGSSLAFGTLAPKGSFVNVSLLGLGATPPSVGEFLNADLVKRLLPWPYQQACGCEPLIAVGPARNPVADGFVAIGDACVTHLYKDGIGSALLTAREAARAAVFHGIGSDDLGKSYLPFCRAIERDNSWGRLLFSVHRNTKNSRTFFLAYARLIGAEQRRPKRRSSRVLWGLFTGSYSYGRLMKLSLSPGALLPLAGAMATELLAYHRPSLAAGPGKRVHILILGGGFGGVYTALRLKRAIGGENNVDVTLVSRENFFLFTPFLHEVATGGIETRHIAYPIRQIRGWSNFRFIHHRVTLIDLAAKKVFLDEAMLEYDYLVLALGGVTDTNRLPGLTDNVFTLKTLRDGMLLRNHIIRMFEAADAESDPRRQACLLTFVVVGGGSTGVQLVTEMRDFIYRFLLKNYPHVKASRIRVTLVQDKEYVLEGMDAKLGAYALDTMRRKGIDVKLKARVTGVTLETLKLADSEDIATRTVVWVAGTTANPLVAAMPLARDQTGRILVNEYLETPDFPGVYALGDNVHFPDRGWAQGLPPRAHIAVRQAGTVAANIHARLRGRPPRRYHYSHMGEMVSLGSHTAAVNVYGLRLYGLAARFIWLNAYLGLLMGGYNRVRVLMDWFLSLAFGRDTTLLEIK
ncbi:MAG: FAD-dependent oxidoreductase [Chloroflexi bacterium]|nr:FAD-dependent oxidoreductase [Chloroflexota bacterium]